MEKFLEKIRLNPTDVISDDKSDTYREPLKLVKSYVDATLKDYQLVNDKGEDTEENGKSFKGSPIEQVVVDGLDANQVWWQVKLVVDNVGADLLRRIQEYNSTSVKGRDEYSDVETDGSEEFGSGAASGSDMEATGSEIGSDNDEEEEEEKEKGVQMEFQNRLEEDSESVSNSEQETLDEEAGENSDVHISHDDSHEEGHTYLDHASGSEEEGENNKIEGHSFDENDPNSLNDEFFNLEEFNRQTLAQENDLNNEEDNDDEEEEEEEIDYFADIPSDEDEEAIYYEDFFDKPSFEKSNGQPSRSKEGHDTSDHGSDSESALQSLKKDLFEEPEDEVVSDEEDEGTNTKKLSTFEKQQLEIQKQIKQLEEEAIAEKKWALKGEVKAKDRPEDALLTEDLDFERTAKPVPVITNDVSVSLEDMIRKRIQDYNFDDLPRRTIVDITKKNHPKLDFELSDAKSSKSLAELYEDDYKGVDQNHEISEALQRSHDEISELYKKICYKLDALSSAHFVPKPAQKSLEVRVESSAVVMEDAQPLTMSTSSTLAPQEVYKVGKAESADEIRLKDGTVMARDELTREDKSRIRRANKRRYAKSIANAPTTQQQQPSKKKSKTDGIIKTLSQAKNVTIVNSKGEQFDTKGSVKTQAQKSSSNSLKL